MNSINNERNSELKLSRQLIYMEAKNVFCSLAAVFIKKNILIQWLYTDFVNLRNSLTN